VPRLIDSTASCLFDCVPCQRYGGLLTQGKKIKKSSRQDCFSLIFLDIMVTHASICITQPPLWILFQLPFPINFLLVIFFEKALPLKDY
jgi:hypothetical protein